MPRGALPFLLGSLLIMDLNETTGIIEDISTESDIATVDVVDPYAVNGESYASRAARTSGLGTVPVNDLVQQIQRNENCMPQRPKTAFFKPAQQTSARSVFDALAVSNIEPTEISCLQRKMNGEVVVTFKSIQAKDRFLGLNSLLIDSQHYAVQDIDRPLAYLTVYDAPFELSDFAIIKRLSPFCEVVHYRRGKHSYAPNVYNGLRHYRIRIIKPIPSFLRFGKIQIYLKHNGQLPTCRRCNCPGHYSNACNNKICFNCEETGHEARQCTQPLLCCICKEPGHLGANCYYSWVFPTVQGAHTDEADIVNIEDDEQQHSPSANTDDDSIDENLPLGSFLPPPKQSVELAENDPLPEINQLDPEQLPERPPATEQPSTQPDPITQFSEQAPDPVTQLSEQVPDPVNPQLSEQEPDPVTPQLSEQPPDQLSQPSSLGSPLVTSQGLIASLKCAITSSSRRTPAKFSSDSSLACIRKSTQPTLVSGKQKSSIPVPTVSSTPLQSSTPPSTTTETDMETSHDLKRKSSDLSPNRKAPTEKKKGRNRNSKKSK